MGSGDEEENTKKRKREYDEEEEQYESCHDHQQSVNEESQSVHSFEFLILITFFIRASTGYWYDKLFQFLKIQKLFEVNEKFINKCFFKVKDNGDLPVTPLKRESLICKFSCSDVFNFCFKDLAIVRHQFLCPLEPILSWDRRVSKPLTVFLLHRLRVVRWSVCFFVNLNITDCITVRIFFVRLAFGHGNAQ